MSTAPGQSEILTLPISQPDLHPDTDYWLTVSFTLAEDTAWAVKGHEVAWEQFRVPFKVPDVQPWSVSTLPELKLEDGEDEVTIKGNQFQIKLDKQLGSLASFVVADKELIARSPRLNFWRAPTENDLNTWGDEKAAIHWREAGLDQLEEKVIEVRTRQLSPQTVNLTIKTVQELKKGAKLPEGPSPDEQLFFLIQGMNMMLDERLVKLLCARLGLDFDDLPGSDKNEKIRSLVIGLGRENRIFELLLGVQQLLGDEGLPIPEELAQVVAAGKIEMQAETGSKQPAQFDCEYEYTIYGSGEIVIDAHVVPSPGLPFLPRIGLQMGMPGGFEEFTWYGRGPHETYSDRQEGAQVDVFHGTVDEQYVPYIFPEENGNKTEVRWAALADADGAGLMAIGDPWLSVSVHHFTTEDLTSARHTYELKRRDEITVNLDYAQSGLGSASCGPGRLEKYKVKPEETRFMVRLRPFTAADGPLVELSKKKFG